MIVDIRVTRCRGATWKPNMIMKIVIVLMLMTTQLPGE